MYTYGQKKKSKYKTFLAFLILAAILFIFFKDDIAISNKLASNNPTSSNEEGLDYVSNSDPEILSSDQAEAGLGNLDQRIKQYLMDNPEVIIQAVEKYQANQHKKMQEESNDLVKKHIDQIKSLNNTPYLGSKNSKDYIVHFFDYNCGYCQRAADAIKILHEKHKDILIIFKELPILGENSEAISKVALAINKINPSLYFNFYTKMISSEIKNLDNAKKIASELGIEAEVLEKHMNDKDILESLSENQNLAKDIKVRGTPYIVVNGIVMNGIPSYETFIAAIKDKK